ncbi:MAG: 2-amino-4-hydroxy-6-hydroxymethyldihydropteridine diphosphokinase [Chloroflexota bacterium]
MEQKIYLALGTNLGDREINLRDALAALPPKVSLSEQSPIYETVPWGFDDQPNFLNMVIEGGTNLSPFELLAYLKEIEFQLGRRPTFRNGPRVVDLDILFYDDWIVQSEELVIPHPRLHKRAFVLVPLADIAPNFLHPSIQTPIQELLDSLGSEGVVLYRPSAAFSEL